MDNGHCRTTQPLPSAKNRERLRGSPSVIVDQLGRGAVVLLIDNTNFGGYRRGTNRLFLNALFFPFF